MYKEGLGLLEESSVRVVNGSLCTSHGDIIESPSIVIDDDALLGVGDYKVMKAKFTILVREFKEASIDTSKLNLIKFDRCSSDKFTINDICYIVRRCFEFSGTGFTRKLGEMWSSNIFLSWLKAEEDKVPLQTEEGIYD